MRVEREMKRKNGEYEGCEAKTVEDCIRICGGRVVMVRYNDGSTMRLKDYLRRRKRGLLGDAGRKEGSRT